MRLTCLALAPIGAIGVIGACVACGGADPQPGGAMRSAAATSSVAAIPNGAVPGDPQQDATAAPREIQVIQAASGRLPRAVLVSGTLAADQQLALAMKVTGRIESIPVDLGSRVRRGDLIARLAQPDFTLRVEQAESALEQARARLGLIPDQPHASVRPEDTAGVHEADAQLHQARVTYGRQQSLFRQQLISQQDLDAAEANYQVAEARREDAVEEARNRLATLGQRQSEVGIARQALYDSTLTAPFDGAIRERRAVAGDYVAVGQPIAVLVRMHPLRLRLAVPERDSGALRIGQTVSLTVEADQRSAVPGAPETSGAPAAPRTFTGRVARLSPAISEDNRTLMVEAEVPNREGLLRPGSFARATIVVEEAPAARPTVLVPASAVVTFAGTEKVIGVALGRAREREVKLGRRAGDLVEVLDGLAAGEPVVVHPGNLVGGQRVKIVK